MSIETATTTLDTLGQPTARPQGGTLSRWAPLKRLVRALAWPLSIVVSALLTSTFKDYWEAPRPVLQMTEFKTLNPSPGDSNLILDPSLVKAVGVHPYFEALESRMTRSSLRDKIREYQDERDVEGEVERYIPSLLRLLRTQSPAIPVEKRRRELLQMISDEPDQHEIIPQASKFTLDTFESRLPAEYQHHPEGLTNLMVPLTHSVADLSEIDETKTDGLERLNAHRKNLYKRLFVYYDQDLLVDFFATVQQYTHDNNTKADSLISQLNGLLDPDAGKKIALSVLVTNRGSRPLPILPVGILRLEVPSPQDSKPAVVALVSMTSREGDPEIQIVKGGEALTVHLISTDTLVKVIQSKKDALGGEDWDADKPLDSSRLMLLYRGKTGGLTASIALARPGVEPKNALVGPSGPLPVMASSTERILEELKTSW